MEPLHWPGELEHLHRRGDLHQWNLLLRRRRLAIRRVGTAAVLPNRAAALRGADIPLSGPAPHLVPLCLPLYRPLCRHFTESDKVGDKVGDEVQGRSDLCGLLEAQNLLMIRVLPIC